MATYKIKNDEPLFKSDSEIAKDMQKSNKTISKNKINNSESIIKDKIVDTPKGKELVMTKANKTDNSNLTPILTVVKLRLNTITNTRKSMGRIVRMAASGEIDSYYAGRLAYLIQVMLAAWKVEGELSYIKRIEAIEKEIRKHNKEE